MILIGTDFSTESAAAARAAAAIARRLGDRLELVHVNGDQGSEARVRAAARELESTFGIEVGARVESGTPHERLVDLATEGEARMLVLAPVGGQMASLLGSVAERAAQTSRTPVLVVRDAGVLESWAAGERTLRVVVGCEMTALSGIALRWAATLTAIGSCELAVGRIAWPAEEHPRHGVEGPIPLDRLVPELERVLLRELSKWASGEGAPDDAAFVVKPGWGRVDHHLTALAQEQNADLLVVGTHQRAVIARLWAGSVSRAVLRNAPMNVACVPSPEGTPLQEGRTD